MLKKIVLGALMVGLVGALVVGAVNRTQSRLGGELSGSANGGNRRLQLSTPVDLTDPHGERETTPNADRPDENGPSNADAGENGARGGWRNGNGRVGRSREAGPGAAVERIALDGVVESAAAEALMVKLPDGRTVEVAHRSWSFAQEQGFTVQRGDRVTLVGVYDGEVFETAAITNHTNGQTVTLRDENGRPMWAGRGRSA